MLIGQNAQNRKEISQFMERARSIRNDIVHGSEVKTPITINKKEYRMSDFSLQLQKYLRVSIKKLI